MRFAIAAILVGLLMAAMRIHLPWGRLLAGAVVYSGR